MEHEEPSRRNAAGQVDSLQLPHHEPSVPSRRPTEASPRRDSRSASAADSAPICVSDSAAPSENGGGNEPPSAPPGPVLPYQPAGALPSYFRGSVGVEDAWFPWPVDEEISPANPSQEDRRRDRHLCIDFDRLERLIELEELEELERPTQVFPDLRSQAPPRATTPKITTDGDIVSIPRPQSSLAAETNCPGEAANEQTQHADAERFNFYSSTLQSTIHGAQFRHLCSAGGDVRTLFKVSTEDVVASWWLDMNNPLEEEVHLICEAFGVHPLTIEDILAQEANEKIELFPSYYFACFRSFNAEGSRYIPLNIYVVVFREGVLSFCFTPSAHAAHVRGRIALLQDYISPSSDWIAYALIDDIIDSFVAPLHRLEDETDAIEDQVFIIRRSDMHETLRRIGTARKDIMDLLRILGSKANVLSAFTKRCSEDYRITPGTGFGVYFSDLQDHVVTTIHNLSHLEKILSRSQSNTLTQMSIDRVSQGNDVNRRLRRVTTWATVLVLLFLVCALFGMNIRIPWQAGNDDDIYAFLGVAGASLFIVALALLVRRCTKY